MIVSKEIGLNGNSITDFKSLLSFTHYLHSVVIKGRVEKEGARSLAPGGLLVSRYSSLLDDFIIGHPG